jgi:hypothetical protein
MSEIEILELTYEVNRAYNLQAAQKALNEYFSEMERIIAGLEATNEELSK